jgi:hypothetical protein
MAVFKERTNKDGVATTYWRLSRIDFSAQDDPRTIRVLWAGYASQQHRRDGARPVDHIWETFPMGDALSELYPRIQGMSPEFAGAEILEDEMPAEPETQGGGET